MQTFIGILKKVGIALLIFFGIVAVAWLGALSGTGIGAAIAILCYWALVALIVIGLPVYFILTLAGLALRAATRVVEDEKERLA